MFRICKLSVTRHLVNLAGKRAWHEHHLSRKKCRVRMRRQYIIDASWTVYEQETWNRLNEIVGNPDVTVEDVEVFALEVILFGDVSDSGTA